MKKIFPLLLILFISICIYPEERETNFDIKDIPKEIQYCKVIGHSFSIDSPPVISIDFGQKWIAKKFIKKSGKKILFNSIIETLNFMYNNGWEYMSSYIVSGGFGFKHHYILQRRK